LTYKEKPTILALMPIKLALHALLQPEGRFISSPGTPDRDYRLSPLKYGDQIPIRVFGWNRDALQSQQMVSEDLQDYYVELTVGSRNERPTLGFFNIAFDGGDTSAPVNINATALEVQTALRYAGVDVIGQPGNLVITSAGTGARSTPVVQFIGDLSISPLVTEISPGTSATYAQWRLEFPEAAPASISANGWTVESVVPSVSAVQVSNTDVWNVTIDRNAVSGFFRISVNGNLTTYLPLGASPAEVQSAVRALPGGAQGALVMPGNFAGCTYSIAFTATVAVEVNGWGLLVPPSLYGVLDLNTDGIRDMLGESNTADAFMTLAVYDAASGTLITYAETPVVVMMPVQRPGDFSGISDLARLNFIDLPDMATGLWHRVTLAGTNAAPTFEVDTDGAEYEDQVGPIFIADEDSRSVYMLSIFNAETLQITAVKAQGLALNASFQPRAFALESPEDDALFCPIEVTPPALPAFAEPGTLVIGDPA
jgi:hypothetical protein